MQTTRLQLAEALARHFHAGQTYGSNVDYYEYHIQGVVAQMSVHNLEEDTIIVANLHDIIEDTECDIDTIRQLFGDDVADAVLAMTYKAFDPNETREAYLKRCASNKIARVVKLHDATFNATNCLKNKNKDRFNYYAKTIASLGLIT